MTWIQSFRQTKNNVPWSKVCGTTTYLLVRTTCTSPISDQYGQYIPVCRYAPPYRVSVYWYGLIHTILVYHTYHTSAPIGYWYGMYQIIQMYWHMIRWGVLIDRYVPPIPVPCRIDTYCPYRAVRRNLPWSTLWFSKLTQEIDLIRISISHCYSIFSQTYVGDSCPNTLHTRLLKKNVRVDDKSP